MGASVTDLRLFFSSDVNNGARNLPLSNSVAMSHRFWYVVFSFSFSSMFCFVFPLRLPLGLVDFLKVCCFVSSCLEIFLFSLCKSVTSWIPLWLQNTFCRSSVLLNSLRSGSNLSWNMFCGPLRITCILLLSRMF